MIFVWSPSGTKQMSWLSGFSAMTSRPSWCATARVSAFVCAPTGSSMRLQHRAVDAPEEVRLVLRAIEAAMQHAVVDARVVARRDPLRVDRVGLHEQIAELRERVAAHARNRRAAARVLVHEVVDDVAAERALEIEHVVRHAELLADAPRVVDRVERAARAVGQIVAVAEELHRRADDVVALLDEHRRGDRRIDAARHRDEHALARSLAVHAQLATPRHAPRALSTSAGNTSRDAVDARVGRQAAEAHANRRRREVAARRRSPSARATA